MSCNIYSFSIFGKVKSYYRIPKNPKLQPSQSAKMEQNSTIHKLTSENSITAAQIKQAFQQQLQEQEQEGEDIKMVTTKYMRVKVKPKRSSIRNRLRRKSGISKLSEEIFSAQFVQELVGANNQRDKDSANASSTEKRSARKKPAKEDKQSIHLISQQAIQQLKTQSQLKESHEQMILTLIQPQSHQSPNPSRAESPSIKITPCSINETLYPSLFPLGSKSYGSIVQNYYCIIINNNEVINVNRNAIAGSRLVYANIQVSDQVVDMYSVNVVEFGTDDHQDQEEKNKKLKDVDIRLRKPSLSLPNDGLNGLRRNSKFQSRRKSRYFDSLQKAIITNLVSKPKITKKSYFHINIAQYNLKKKKTIKNHNFCLQFKQNGLAPRTQSPQSTTTAGLASSSAVDRSQDQSTSKTIGSVSIGGQFSKLSYNFNNHHNENSNATKSSLGIGWTKLQKITNSQLQISDTQGSEYAPQINKMKKISMIVMKKGGCCKSTASSDQDKSSKQPQTESEKESVDGEMSIRCQTQGKNGQSLDKRVIEQLQLQQDDSQGKQANCEMGTELVADKTGSCYETEQAEQSDGDSTSLVNDSIISINIKDENQIMKSMSEYNRNNTTALLGLSTNDPPPSKTKPRRNRLQSTKHKNKSKSRSRSRRRSRSGSKIKDKRMGKVIINLKERSSKKLSSEKLVQQPKQEIDRHEIESIMLAIEDTTDDSSNNLENGRANTNKYMGKPGQKKENPNPNHNNSNIKIFYINLKQLMEKQTSKSQIDPPLPNYLEPSYKITKYEYYNQFLHEGQTTVLTNWLKIEEGRLYLVTNLSIYQIEIRTIFRALLEDGGENTAKNGSEGNNQDQSQLQSRKGLNGRKDAMKFRTKLSIKCKNQRIMEKIAEFQSTKISTPCGRNKSHNEADQFHYNPFRTSSNLKLTNDQLKPPALKEPVLKKYSAHTQQSPAQIITCCFLNRNKFLLLTSNSLVYQVEDGNIVGCKDFIKLIRETGNLQFRGAGGQSCTDKKNSSNADTGPVQNNDRHYQGQLLQVLQISCIRGCSEEVYFIIARIQAICDILQTRANATSLNIEIGESQSEQYVGRGGGGGNRAVCQVESEFFVFKHNKRWTEFYTKLENFIDEKIMTSGIPVKVAKGSQIIAPLASLSSLRSSNPTPANPLQLLPEPDVGSCKSMQKIHRYNIDPRTIQVKILDRSNWIPTEYLGTQEEFQAHREAEQQFFIYCQWGLILDDGATGHTRNKEQEGSGSEQDENREQGSWDYQSKCFISTRSPSKKKFFQSRKKFHNPSQYKLISHSSLDNDGYIYLAKPSNACRQLAKTMEMFIVELNIFGKRSKKVEELNPMCIKLQDYYNPNLLNIYQLRFRTGSKAGAKQSQTSLIGKNSQGRDNRSQRCNSANKEDKIYKKQPLTYSASTDMSNMATMTVQKENLKLVLHEKNGHIQHKPQHFLHTGLSTKLFQECFSYQFEPSLRPITLCLDNLALYLIIATADKIRMNFIMKDQIVRGPELGLRGIVFLSYDRYNWHLYAHNRNYLYIVDPWKFEVLRELAFEGDILEVRIGSEYIFVQWREKINEAIFLTVFHLYEAISQNFKTYQTELDVMIQKAELERYQKICELYGGEAESQNRRMRRPTAFSQIKTELTSNQTNLSTPTAYPNPSQFYQLRHAYQTCPNSNKLFIINQYYLQVHQMQFTSVFDREEVLNDEEYYGQYYANWKKRQQANLNSKNKKYANVGRGHSRTNSKIYKNAKVSISISSSKTGMKVPLGTNGKGGRMDDQISQRTELSSKISSNLESLKDRGDADIADLRNEQEEMDGNIQRIRISFNKHSAKNKSILPMEDKQWPTFVKYQPQSFTLLIATNLGKVVAIHYNPNCMQHLSPHNRNRNSSIFPISLAPFFSQTVTPWRIDELMLSSNSFMTTLYIYTRNASIMCLKISDTKENMGLRIKPQTKVDDRKETSAINKKQAAKMQYMKSVQSRNELGGSNEFFNSESSTHSHNTNKNSESLQYEQYPVQKHNRISYHQLRQSIPLNQNLPEHQLHTQVTKKYRLYTVQQIDLLANHIQQLELILLKIRGDREQLVWRNKQKSEQQLKQKEMELHQLKVMSRQEQAKMQLISKKCLEQMKKTHAEECKNMIESQKAKEKHKYHEEICKQYAENDRLKAIYSAEKSKLQKQYQKFAQTLGVQSQRISSEYNKKLNQMHSQIDQLTTNLELSRKAEAIQLQQTEYEQKQLKKLMVADLNDCLTSQLQFEHQLRYRKWKKCNDVAQMSQKLAELDHLSLLFRTELERWAQKIEEKKGYLSWFEAAYGEKKQELTIWEQEQQRNRAKSMGSYAQLHNAIYELNQKINFCKIQAQQDYQQILVFQSGIKELDTKTVKLAAEVQQQKDLLKNKNDQIGEKNAFLKILLQKMNTIKSKCNESRIRYRDLMDNCYKFADECGNGYFQKLVEQSNSKQNSHKFQRITLKLVKPPKYQIKHLKYLNEHILKFKIELEQSLKAQKQPLPISPSKNPNKEAQIQAEQKKLQQFMQNSQQIKSHRLFLRLGASILKKQQNFITNTTFSQTYHQNSLLIRDLNNLREQAHELQAKERKLKLRYAELAGEGAMERTWKKIRGGPSEKYRIFQERNKKAASLMVRKRAMTSHSQSLSKKDLKYPVISKNKKMVTEAKIKRSYSIQQQMNKKLSTSKLINYCTNNVELQNKNKKPYVQMPNLKNRLKINSETSTNSLQLKIENILKAFPKEVVIEQEISQLNSMQFDTETKQFLERQQRDIEAYIKLLQSSKNQLQNQKIRQRLQL